MPTPNLGMPYLSANQANKEVTHNEAIIIMDVLVQARVLDKDLTAPPGSPTDGAVYIPLATATGAWAGFENYIAYWFTETGTWNFILPKTGWQVFVVDESLHYEWDGTAWHPLDKTTDTITASTTQTQVGSTALSGSYSRITVCANASDAVGLPKAVQGRSHTLQNAGAQVAGVWPKITGDAIDGGAADAVDANTLPVGSTRVYHCFTTGTWRTLFTDA